MDMISRKQCCAVNFRSLIFFDSLLPPAARVMSWGANLASPICHSSDSLSGGLSTLGPPPRLRSLLVGHPSPPLPPPLIASTFSLHSLLSQRSALFYIPPPTHRVLHSTSPAPHIPPFLRFLLFFLTVKNVMSI